MSLLRILLPAVLLAAGTGAHAELVKVFENIRGTVVYADSSTLAVNGHLRRIVEVQSYREPGPRGMLSMKLLKEYHCRDETAQIISYTMYSGRMATGQTIGRIETPGDVQRLVQNPGGTGGWRYACGR